MRKKFTELLNSIIEDRMKILSKKLKAELKPRDLRVLYALLSFCIPFIIILLGYIALHITPFGEHMLLISDAKALYASDLAFISRALRGQEDLLYSFKSGIGMNLMGANSGLGNPANIITLLFDITAWPEMYSMLMAIDIAICGLTMFCFLSGVYGCKGKNLIFSTVYAMMGFNVAYCYHYNFILSPELLPLITLGIHRIIKGKSPWLYILSLGYAIFASFYFGFMLCIASAVFFLFWYMREQESLTGRKRRIWVNYVAGSLCAGLLPALVWLSALLSFSGGRIDQTTISDFTFAENMSLADACAKFFIGANTINEQINGQPNVFIGSLALFLNFAFFSDRHNTTRKRILYAAPLIFYFVTFYIRAFSMVVQGFSATNWFNYRYSFVFSFLMILIAYEEFTILRDMDAADFKKACGAFALFVVLVFGQRYSFVKGGGMLLGVAFLTISLGIIWWNRRDPIRAPSNLLVIVLVLLCSIESYANYLICTRNLRDWETKLSDYQDDLFIGSVFSDAVRQSDQGFFRMENEHATNQYAANDPRLFGYNGLIYFGSCENTFVYQGLSKLGMSWWGNRMWYQEGKPNVFDSLMGVKYVVSQRDLADEKNYERVIEMSGYQLYRNPDALHIAMLVAQDDSEVTLSLNPFENHNVLWKSLTGDDKDVFKQQSEITFTYYAGMDGIAIDREQAQIYSTSVSEQTVEASASDNTESSYSSESNSSAVRDIKAIQQGSHIECRFIAEHDGPIYGYTGLVVDENNGYLGEAMYYIGTFHKGDTVTDYIPVNGVVSEGLLKMLCAEYYAAYPDQGVLDEYSAKLKEKAGSIENLKDSHLVGHIDAEEDSRLFFTIPYDEGWTLTVDGEKVPLNKTADLFMSAPVSAGEHIYELTFFPKGMQTGIYISCGACILLLGLIIYNIIDNRKRKLIVPVEEG